jgi:hypothetical protein
MSCSNCCCGTKATSTKKLDKKLPPKNQNLSTSSSILSTTATSPDPKDRIPTSLTLSSGIADSSTSKNQQPTTTSSSSTASTKKSSK